MSMRTVLGAAMVVLSAGLVMADARADFERAMTVYAAGDFAEAIKLLEPPANEGLAEAQYVLGLMYHRGRGTDVDPAKAVQWYAKAADQNHPAALCNLGIILRDGLSNGQQSVKPDPAKSKDFLRRAAYLENVPAYVAYGAVMINDGDKGNDLVEGIAFMRMAADAGDPIAIDNLKNIKITDAQSQAADAKRKEIETAIQKIREIRAVEAKKKTESVDETPKKNPLED